MTPHRDTGTNPPGHRDSTSDHTHRDRALLIGPVPVPVCVGLRVPVAQPASCPGDEHQQKNVAQKNARKKFLSKQRPTETPPPPGSQKKLAPTAFDRFFLMTSTCRRRQSPTKKAGSELYPGPADR